MRLSRADLRRRINADLAVRYETLGLTSYAGLELVRQYFYRLGLVSMVRRYAVRDVPVSDYGSVAMVLLVLTLLITGGRRVRHIGYLEHDPMAQRACMLKRMPTARSVGRWLRGFKTEGVDALRRLNEKLVAASIEAGGLRRLTLDVDGSVVATGLKVEGARRGYNPHRRKVPSYYPITAYEANSGQLVRVENRAGNVHDGKASVSFLKAVFEQLRTSLKRRYLLEMRMDGAFFRKDVLDLLAAERVEYAIKVPFYPWLGLKARIAKRTRWERVEDTVQCFELKLTLAPWNRSARVVVYRKQVGHLTAKNFQLDLFDPDDGHYEYSAVVTNKTLTGRTLWHFMGGRGTHEKVYGELKSGFAFDCVPTQRFEANSAWQVMSIMAFNLMRGLQTSTTAEKRTSNRQRRSRHRFKLIHTMRYQLINRAGLLVHPAGKSTLDIGHNPMLRERFERVHLALAKVA